MKKIVKGLLLMFMIVSLFGCSHEQTEDIYIVYTNDVAGNLTGDIGYSGVKAYKDKLKSEHKYVSLVDAGDFLDGDVGLFNGGKDVIDIMNDVGYDVVALGNQEFSVGIENLAQDIKNSKFDYVTCNLKYIGNSRNRLKKVKPYVIKRYGGVRIAFIGVVTPETLKPGKLAYEGIKENGEIAYDFYQADDGQELYDQVQKTVDKVRKRAEYVIVLSHLGSNSVAEGFSSYDLITNTTGIDVVIDGHSHTINYGEAVTNKDGGLVVLTSTGERLQNIGVLQIHKNHTYTTALYPSVEEKDVAIEEKANAVYAAMN